MKTKNITNKTKLILLLIFIFIGGGVLIATRISQQKNKPIYQNQIVLSDEKKDINQTFDFKLGKKASFKYVLTQAELKNEIILKGVKAKASNGKRFFIINLKIVNAEKSGFQLRSRDYVRLLVNGENGEWVASDIHNDPLEVQALSTKYTRLGFTVDQNQNQFKISVGEINGEKKEVDINFTK